MEEMGEGEIKKKILKICVWSRKNILPNSKLQTKQVLKHLLIFSVVKEKSAILH